MGAEGPLEAAGLLAVWEAGLAAGALDRALLLHSAARPSTGAEALLAVPVGERDADLFALRGALFGDRMDVRVTCEQCGEEMEFAFAARDAIAAGPPAPGPLEVEAEGWTVRFRLPTPADVAAAARAGPDKARTALLERCVLHAEHEGSPSPTVALPPSVQTRIAQAAAEADPCADVRFAVHCPDCGHRARAELDIAAYLWDELDSWARSTLLDVHLLAAAYGWTEPEILALSPLRRRYYLELCADGYR